MKATCYLRVGRKNGRARWGDSDFVFDVGVKEPKSGLSHNGVPVSTAVLEVNLHLPDEVFGPHATVDIDVPPEAVRHVITGEAVAA